MCKYVQKSFLWILESDTHLDSRPHVATPTVYICRVVWDPLATTFFPATVKFILYAGTGWRREASPASHLLSQLRKSSYFGPVDGTSNNTNCINICMKLKIEHALWICCIQLDIWWHCHVCMNIIGSLMLTKYLLTRVKHYFYFTYWVGFKIKFSKIFETCVKVNRLCMEVVFFTNYI